MIIFTVRDEAIFEESGVCPLLLLRDGFYDFFLFSGKEQQHLSSEKIPSGRFIEMDDVWLFEVFPLNY